MKKYTIYQSGRALFVSWSMVLISAAVLALGFLLPSFLTVDSLHIYEHLSRAIVYEERSSLLIAAMLLVFLNSMRGTPFYMGTYLLGESYVRSSRSNFLDVGRGAVILAVLGSCYIGVEVLYGIRYDFGLPALLLTAFVISLRQLGLQRIRLYRRLMILLWVIDGVQCLDVMPSLGPTSRLKLLAWLPVGRGDISLQIKKAALELGAGNMLDSIGALGFLLFVFFTVSQLMSVGQENEARELLALAKQNESIRLQMQESEMKNRVNEELRYLVHDLKSPLTAMQTMVGVLQMTLTDRPAELELLERMDISMGQMSRMISEIQHSDSRGAVNPSEILRLVMAQLSVAPFAKSIAVANRTTEEDVIYVNRLLFSRALVNLLQNGARSVPAGQTPELAVTAEPQEKYIRFTVRDNGQGLSPEILVHMWEAGVSGSGSTGLGLAFVKRVAEENGGIIEADSAPGRGTVFVIRVPKYIDEETE